MGNLPIVEPQIIEAKDVPPRKTKWAATVRVLKSLRIGKVFTCQLETPMHYEDVRSALYKGAQRLGFKISIRRNGAKLYIERLGDAK
jgi:hypothetical protein